MPRDAISRRRDLCGGALHDVEHAFNIYATNFCNLTADCIYDKEKLSPYMSIIESCHIYMIGFLPNVEWGEPQQIEQQLIITASLQGEQYSLEADIADEFSLIKEDDECYLQNKEGERFWPSKLEILQRLNDVSEAYDFDVQYIGQSYGADGSRNALDRLMNHETLQKISLKGVPDGFHLHLLLMEILPSNRVITVFNPFAQNKDDDGSRLEAGLDKLCDTTEKERVALFEASLIRYFSPTFNKEFKDSFPSTNMKILNDCYEKDFSSIIAEICIEGLPFRLFSDSVEVSSQHIARHELHNDKDRRMFFSDK